MGVGGIAGKKPDATDGPVVDSERLEWFALDHENVRPGGLPSGGDDDSADVGETVRRITPIPATPTSRIIRISASPPLRGARGSWGVCVHR